MHCCILSCFSLVQEYRGVLRWRKETSSGFKAKWKESGKHWWDSAIITISNLVCLYSRNRHIYDRYIYFLLIYSLNPLLHVFMKKNISFFSLYFI
jgi:hypothetical protein